jgi:Fic family protein
LELKSHLEESLAQTYGKRTVNAGLLLNALFKKPVIHVSDAQQLLGLSFKAANDLVSDFQKNGILKEMTGQSRNRVFVFDDYVKLFRI